MPVGVMFPGQGAQRPGLGAPFRDDPAWSVVVRAARALDRPLAELTGLLVDDDARLDRTEDAQLAVLLTSLMAWQALAPSLDPPVVVAGHSLGQITALLATGAVGFDDGIRLAARRARRTQEAADRRPGGMAALLGATPEQAARACAAAPGECWVANDNAPGQIVVAGTPSGLAAATGAARAAGVRRATPLAVGGAFHTPLMADAAAAFAGDLAGVRFAAPTVPVVTNHDATAHHDAHGWPARLADHLVEPVRWRQSVEAMVAAGATELVEVGPGKVLAGLARRIVPAVPVRSSGAPLQEVAPCP